MSRTSPPDTEEVPDLVLGDVLAGRQRYHQAFIEIEARGVTTCQVVQVVSRTNLERAVPVTGPEHHDRPDS